MEANGALGHIHLDPVGGVAGDMFVAALLDAFPELRPRVLDDIEAVLPRGVRAALDVTHQAGLAAKHFSIKGVAATEPRIALYGALAARIEAAQLSPGTGVEAASILRRLAQAEAAVHGVPLERVHFHELADWDSLGDVVAAGSLIAALKGYSFSVSPLPLGGGLVNTAHGALPVPAPATALLLRGFTLRTDHVGGERVTPTGAAILAHLAPGQTRAGRLERIGTGAGTRTLEGLANVLRVLVFTPAAPQGNETVTIVAFAVDDMTGEEIAVAADRLRADPAVLDLAITVRHGKKGRPEHHFELIVTRAEEHRVAERCFAETATIGLRLRHETRLTLARAHDTVAVEGGAVRRKRVARPGGDTVKAEADDLFTGETLAARRARKLAAESPKR